MSNQIEQLKIKMRSAAYALRDAEDEAEDYKDFPMAAWYNGVVERASEALREAREAHLEAILKESEL